MCLSKFSNLDLLRQVVMNLYPAGNLENDNKSEIKLAELIYTFYQIEVSNILSALELVPNEVYEIILKGLGGEDKKNLRITSKILYKKTSLMVPMFQYWGFEANFGIQPDFVLKTEKNFHVSILNANSEMCPTTNLIKNYVNRISSLKIDKEGVLLDFLNTDSAKFTNLTSLDLCFVYFDNESLLQLSPQLENLKLGNLKWLEHVDLHPEKCAEFDISSVDESSNCFTKLRSLKLGDNIEIDVIKILAKCSNTLEQFELSSHGLSLNLDFQHELSSLISLFLTIEDSYYKQTIKNLLSKCTESLKTLKLTLFYKSTKIDYSSILEKSMNITTLQLSSDQSNIEMFLESCPLIQILTLIGHKKEVTKLVLKDLRKLKMVGCNAECVSSLLKHASKSSVKTLYFRNSEISDYNLPVIPKLDTIWIHDYYTDDRKTDVGQVSKLFPRNAKVSTEELIFKDCLIENKTVLRRVYGHPEPMED